MSVSVHWYVGLHVPSETRGIRDLGTRVIGSCKLPEVGAGDLSNLGPLQGQYVLLITELALQPFS